MTLEVGLWGLAVLDRLEGLDARAAIAASSRLSLGPLLPLPLPPYDLSCLGAGEMGLWAGLEEGLDVGLEGLDVLALAGLTVLDLQVSLFRLKSTGSMHA